MEELIKQQEETAVIIIKLLENTKKEAKDKRTSEYVARQQEKFNQQWKIFKERHEAITEFNQPDHEYFLDNLYEQVRRTKSNADAILKTFTATISEKTNPRPDPTNQKSEQLKYHITPPEDEHGKARSLKKFELRIKIFTDLLNEINASESTNASVIEYHTRTLTEAWAKLEALHEEILLQSSADDYADENFEKLMKKYDEVKAKHRGLIITMQERKHTLQESHMTENEIRLPRLTIPVFDGKYESWTAFHDIFTRLIHNNNKLADIEKMQYLKTNLKGEAGRLLSHLELSQGNYKTAWQLLKTRYENKRKLISTQIQTIMVQPKLEVESANGIRKLHDTTKECLYALSNLGIDTSSWAPIIAHIVIQKFDSETHKLYEQSLKDPRAPPTFEAIYNFLENRFQSLEALRDSKRRENSNYPSGTKITNKFKYKNYYTTYDATKCQYCQSSHSIYNCMKFKNLDPQKKREFIVQNKLCANCLNHSEREKCHSHKRCVVCQQPHHSMLHPAYNARLPTNRSASQQQPAAPGTAIVQAHVSKHNINVLLATAVVKAKKRNGQYEYLRALVDPGSQASFISESAAQLLGIRRTKIHASISGMGASDAGIARTKIQLEIKPRFSSNFNLTYTALVLSKLTKFLPNQRIEYRIKSGVLDMIADPTYDTPGSIDLIIGADIYGKIILNGIYKEETGIIAQRTELGWIISGQIPGIQNHHIKITSMVSNVDIEQQLRKFWEIEELDSSELQSTEDEKCEQIYAQTHVRNADGTYTVSIPFKTTTTTLGDSRRQAMARLLQNERKFLNNKRLQDDYKKFMDEYLALGHMIPANNSEPTGYYLPHHAVMKADSSTTKLRVVFDASMKTTNGVSLNDIMYTGPRLQNDLTSILLRWRKHRYVMTADVEKMYRQIKVSDQDHKYQKILWRSSPDQPINEYYLTTVTYGTACAPFLALRTLRQLAIDEKETYPEASKTVLRDFYVDDLITGTDTLFEARSIQRSLVDLLNAGGFKLRKWTSNRRELLEGIPQELRETKILDIHEEDAIKTLGLHWNPTNDSFQFYVNLPSSTLASTKRTVLADIAKIFDPLGWLAPIIVSAKILMQDIWLAGLNWDQAIPADLERKWKRFKDELSSVQAIKIPRWIKYKNSTQHTELHGFCDASEKAYAAVVYSRIITEQGDQIITLLTSKTKVAPIKKKITIPRLELCAAVLLTNLMKNVVDSLEFPNTSTFMWSDSRIALAWINGEPHQWKSFVAHRVADIHSKSNGSKWKYVKSEDNPADCASRGIYPSQLKRHCLWWTGPQWLQLPKEQWPESSQRFQTNEEKRKTECVTYSTTITFTDLINKYSSMTKLIRVVAYCQRFISNCRGARDNRSTCLSTAEYHNASCQVIRMVQTSAFADEIGCISHQKKLSSKSKLISLFPFIDEEGILRVGGRLQHSYLSFSERHPIILPHHHHFTDLVIQNAHQVTLHGGNQATLAYIRRKFWILDAKSATRKIIHKCITCSRHKAVTVQQAMGNLPAPRVTPSRPFLYTGVDYAGPFQIKSSKLRGAKIQKAYVAIFICLATKAIHVEVISDLTTEAFMAALKRMTARRGTIAHIYSDCGTTFIGADNELDRRFHSMIQQARTDVAEKLVSRGIQWHFNPPAAPHFGGLWEAGVKSIKYHMKRILGGTTMTFEELTTVLYEIEACLNSRPLCPISSDPNDLTVLTPGHFLIGDALVTPPELTSPEFGNHLTRWKLLNKLQNDFWKAWSTEYLSRLQQRPKWRTQHENVQIGDIVLIKDEDTPPSKWPLARIIEVHPGQDGLVRVVTLKTAKTTFKRPLTKICKLPVTDEAYTRDTAAITNTSRDKCNNAQGPENRKESKPTQWNTTTTNNKRSRKRTRIHPVQGYSTLIPIQEQQRLAEKYNKEFVIPSKRTKPHLALSHTTILGLLLLFFVALAAGSYNIKYPKPGLYIEHIGQCKIRRGTLRLELNIPANITADIEQVNRTITQMKNICDTTREVSDEIHCDRLVQHLHQKQLTLLEELHVLRDKGLNREKRSIIGRVLETIFGGNEDVYQNIDALKGNQELLRQTAHHQSTLLLSTMATINHTEARTTQKINMISTKLNKVITEVNKAQGWFNSIDHNKVNIHIISSYQLASDLINDIEHQYVKIVEATLGKGTLFDFISPRQLTNIITSATNKIPAYLQLAPEPEKRIEVRITNNSAQIFGFLHITGMHPYILDRVTPIPQKLGNQTFVGADISTPLIATSYDTQTYFTLTETELGQCIKQEMVLLCNPTVVSSIDDNPNCIIDEIYHRTDKKPCPLKKFTTPRTLWKHLHMKNTWLFISNYPLTAAIKCNGIREDAVLNGTGIIQIGQECMIQTRKNTLTSEAFNTIPVKSTFSKPINFNLNTITKVKQQQFTHIDTEPVLKRSDQFSDLMEEQRSIQSDLYSGAWRTIGYHTATGTSAVVITILLIIVYKYSSCRRKSIPFNMKISSPVQPPPQPTKRTVSKENTTPQTVTQRTNYTLASILQKHATPIYAKPAECLRSKHGKQKVIEEIP